MPRPIGTGYQKAWTQPPITNIATFSDGRGGPAWLGSQ
jgi:hypothetical protein